MIRVPNISQKIFKVKFKETKTNVTIHMINLFFPDFIKVIFLFLGVNSFEVEIVKNKPIICVIKMVIAQVIVNLQKLNRKKVSVKQMVVVKVITFLFSFVFKNVTMHIVKIATAYIIMNIKEKRMLKKGCSSCFNVFIIR